MPIGSGCGGERRRGLFTSLVCDALDGGAADVRGSVNVSSLYSFVDEVLTIFQQRPLLKANVSQLIPIRRAGASVSDEMLRKLTKYFATEEDEYPLDPSYEPRAAPRHPEHEAIFAVFQRYRGARLLVPIGVDHLYDAAMSSKSCKLTPLGRLYWRCVRAKKI